MKFRFSVLGITGSSGSGKTTLIEQLLPMLTRQGYRINAIKNSHHAVELEPKGKDSARMRMAGAAEVLLSCPYRYMLVRELHHEAPPNLDELISRMTPADLTLVEGFREEKIPRLEVFRPGLGKKAMYHDDAQIVAVASDMPCPQDLPRPLVWLDLNDVKKIHDWLFVKASHDSHN